MIVTVPPSYGAGNRRYPVIYVLDGAENALTAASAVRFLAGSGRIPEMIVDGQTGLLFQSGNVRDLTDKLLSLAHDPGRLRAMR